MVMSLQDGECFIRALQDASVASSPTPEPPQAEP